MVSYTGGKVEQVRDEIKKHIIEYGPVSARIYRNSSDVKDCFIYRIGGEERRNVEYDPEGSDYVWYTKDYQSTKDLLYYCNNDQITPNTDVIIIGWDDEYQIPGAPGRGAYLVMDPNTVNFSYYLHYSIDDYYYRKKKCVCKWYENREHDAAGRCWARSNMVTVNTNYYYVSYYDYYIESQIYGIKETYTTVEDLLDIDIKYYLTIFKLCNILFIFHSISFTSITMHFTGKLTYIRSFPSVCVCKHI